MIEILIGLPVVFGIVAFLVWFVQSPDPDTWHGKLKILIMVVFMLFTLVGLSKLIGHAVMS
jgi:hypothetical protein